MGSEPTCSSPPLSVMEFLKSYEETSMESKPSISLSSWDYIHYFLLRPLLAALFVSFILAVVWWVAWKTVLVHVPLVQEIFGLRKKPPKPPRPERRYTRYYNSLNAARNSVPPQS